MDRQVASWMDGGGWGGEAATACTGRRAGRQRLRAVFPGRSAAAMRSRFAITVLITPNRRAIQPSPSSTVCLPIATLLSPYTPHRQPISGHLIPPLSTKATTAQAGVPPGTHGEHHKTISSSSVLCTHTAQLGHRYSCRRYCDETRFA